MTGYGRVTDNTAPTAVVNIERLLRDAVKAKFQSMFAQHRVLFERFLDKPGCGGCRTRLVMALTRDQEALKAYYGEHAVFDFDVPEQSPSSMDKAGAFVVINCPVEDLANQLNKLPSANYQIAVARDDAEVTVVVKPLSHEEDGPPFTVINCDPDELNDRLNQLPFTGYRIAASRSHGQVTVVLQPFE